MIMLFVTPIILFGILVLLSILYILEMYSKKKKREENINKE